MQIKETFSLGSSVPAGYPTSLGYFLTTPTDFDPAKERLPLILFLHGAGERGTGIDIVKVNGIPKVFAADPDYHGLRVITLSPQCPDNMVWSDIIHLVKALTDEIAAKYNCDPDRITCTGLSMGGFGTWSMGIRFNDYFAAIAACCGGGRSWEADRLKKIPVRAYHGLKDGAVEPIYSQLMVDAVNRCGGHAELFTYPETGHDVWVPAYEQTDLIEWLAAAHK